MCTTIAERWSCFRKETGLRIDQPRFGLNKKDILSHNSHGVRYFLTCITSYEPHLARMWCDSLWSLLSILHYGLWSLHRKIEWLGQKDKLTSYLTSRGICPHREPISKKLKEIGAYKYWTLRSIEKHLLMSIWRRKRDF